jgi:hypothetical protein
MRSINTLSNCTSSLVIDRSGMHVLTIQNRERVHFVPVDRPRPGRNALGGQGHRAAPQAVASWIAEGGLGVHLRGSREMRELDQKGRLYVQWGSIQQILIAERLGEEFPCPSLRARSVPCGARSVRSNHGYPDVIRLERITGYCQRWPLYGRLALYQKPTDNLEGM